MRIGLGHTHSHGTRGRKGMTDDDNGIFNTFVLKKTYFYETENERNGREGKGMIQPTFYISSGKRGAYLLHSEEKTGKKQISPINLRETDILAIQPLISGVLGVLIQQHECLLCTYIYD